MDTLTGARVLVTGASSGIGWALAEDAARRGARLALVARRHHRLDALAARIGGDPLVLPADLSHAGAAAGVAARIEAAWGGVDVLVNNAGSAVGGTVWAVGDSDEARRAFEVDLWSALAFIAQLVPGMKARHEGAVVNVTSLRTVLAWPFFGHSSAAKAALSLATETLRLELLGTGVGVVEVVPGPIETPAQGPTKLLPGIEEGIHARFGTAEPEQLAALVLDAVLAGHDRVFCPESVRAAYEDPTTARRQITDVVRRLGPGGLPDDLVVGADDPVILQARDDWESAHRPTTS